MTDKEQPLLDDPIKRFRRLMASKQIESGASNLDSQDSNLEEEASNSEPLSEAEGWSPIPTVGFFTDGDTTPLFVESSESIDGKIHDESQSIKPDITNGQNIINNQASHEVEYSPNAKVETHAVEIPTIGIQSGIEDTKPHRPKSRKINVQPIRKRYSVVLPAIDWKYGFGCLIRMIIFAIFGFVVLLLITGSFVLYEYYNIAATLPSVDDLRQRASTFETTRIYDRNGNLLYEVLDPNAGRRTYIPLEKISPTMVAATIATEDKAYYSHPGFDWLAILRAFWQNYQSGGETISGASTITQQLARTLLFSPEERSQRTYMRKVREALLAEEITRRYSKDEIIELYLNEIYYGNLAYGVQAAAETYFGTSADRLNLAQASFLAGLPQAPSIYDIYSNPEITKLRHQDVLILMYETSLEQNCIFVSNSFQDICVDAESAVAAYNELEGYSFNSPGVQIRYPHWVNFIRSQLEDQFDPQTIYKSGFSVYTTLNPELQIIAEDIVSRQVSSLEANNAHNGALVAIRPSTGEILAMVGSVEYYNEEIDGQVNMALSPTRQPGSSIKPVTYLAAFEKGWTPSTLIWDVPSEFPPSGDPNDPRPPYKPVNYDGRFHGPVVLRSALANSYNVPAVKTLQFVGIYDNPEIPGEDGMISMAKRLGITTLNRSDYGLSLTLGGGEVSLYEMTKMYAVLANGGRSIPPVAISRIIDRNGNIIFDYKIPPGEQVIRTEHAFMISSILSDNAARTPAFGANSVLNLPFQAVAKTGTTNDFRDNWTIGYTPDIAVGVWVGNADYTPMQNISGLSGAAPIWADFMQAAIQEMNNGLSTPFVKPAGVIDRVVCSVSGTEPSQWCPNQKSEIFTADQLPLPKDQDLWTRVEFDTWTGLRASAACSEFTSEEFAANVTDEWGKRWLREDAQGRSWASDMGFGDSILFVPPRECRADDPRPYLKFTSLSEGQTVTESPLEISAQVDANADFDNFTLRYGEGNEPDEWHLLTGDDEPINPASAIYSWDLTEIPTGPVTLHLLIRSIRDTYAEKYLRLNLQVPTPTPTPTNSPTPTSTSTPKPTATPTPSPTATLYPTSTPVPTDTPFTLPSVTPTATP